MTKRTELVGRFQRMVRRMRGSAPLQGKQSNGNNLQ